MKQCCIYSKLFKFITDFLGLCSFLYVVCILLLVFFQVINSWCDAHMNRADVNVDMYMAWL